MKQGKLSKKVLKTRRALEKKKFVARLKKSNPSEEVGADEVHDAISKSNVSRLRTLLKGLQKKGNKKYASNAPQDPVYDTCDQVPYDTPSTSCPWQEKHTGDLTDELSAFQHYAQLTEAEHQLRQLMLDGVTSLVQQRWRHATANAFGSYPARLSTFLSDVDIYLSFDKNTKIEDEVDEPIEVANDEAPEVFDEAEGLWCIDLTGVPTAPATEDAYVASDSESEISDTTETDADMHFNIMNAEVSSSNVNINRLSWTATVEEHEPTVTSIPRHQQLNYLRELRSRLKWIPWVASLELRSRARVPIINLQHTSGCVECDIGIIEENTSELVLELSSGRMLSDMSEDFYCKYSLVFKTLVMFLKVFLWNYGLDKPFTGGIGSFKLYVMVAHILLHAPKEAVMACDTGFLLIVFLKFFGSEKNLNRKCIVRAGSAEALFEGAHLVDQCRKTFHVAYLALSARLQLLSEKSHNSKLTSYLSLIINTNKVQRYRQASLRQCSRYASEKPTDDAIAALVLSEVQRLHQLPMMPTVSEVYRFDPVLGSVLSALQSTQDAMYLVYGRRDGERGIEVQSNNRKNSKRPHADANGQDYSQHAKRWSRHDHAKKKKQVKMRYDPFLNDKHIQKLGHKKFEQHKRRKS